MLSDDSRPPLRDADSLYFSSPAWFGIAFATFWMALIAHEGAHFGAARMLYSPAELSSGQVAAHHQLLVVGAGPAFTLAMIVACAAASHWTTRGKAVGIAAIAFGVSRLLMIAPATLLNRGMNDERTVAQILGVSDRLLWIGETFLAITALIFVARGTRIAERPRSLMSIAAGIVAGWASALTLGRAIGLPI